jgi:hypothetical protein
MSMGKGRSRLDRIADQMLDDALAALPGADPALLRAWITTTPATPCAIGTRPLRVGVERKLPTSKSKGGRS